MTRRLALVLLSLAFAMQGLAQAPDEPWGYVYVFRTLQWYPLVEDDNRIGRLPENRITLISPRVSRRHAAIRRTDAGIELLDVGSSNGSRLNGKPLKARAPVALHAGDRIQLADELLLFHTSLEGLLREELRLRLLSSMVKLHVDLPEDRTLKSFGRERLEPAVTEAVLSSEEGTAELKPSADIEPGTGFAKDGAAFVGNVDVEDSVLHISLWGIAAGGKMTSRRSSISHLKHTTLKVALADGGGFGGTGPWFPSSDLSSLFDVFPDQHDISLLFARSLASQHRADALRDGAESLAFRHILTPEKGKLLALAAKTKGLWVDTVVSTKKLSLTEVELDELQKALEGARLWLEECRRFGVHGKPAADAEQAIERAGKRLTALRGQ